ncbi:hypothetical protein [Moraxella catarrhalis]|uniref:hypothetical protein n=1 Tax=Moraxella catarrhalis TaxID=480 RepID=UPI0007E44AA1|nr:hypothetical protein [Moraxella catarrhalis]OAV36335.1 hypothetical protein AO365_0730 [Moraxella catarrhalis]
MIFRTYTKQGQILLDSQTPVFALIKTVTPTRLLTPPFDQNKRELWYRAKRLGFNSKMRQRWVNIYTKEYCMYYADVPSVMTPITTISYDGMAHECEPIVFLNAGQFDGKTRLMFYSNGRLSDGQLARYRIHVFDINVQRQTQVGINLYDKKGNVTFSNHSRLLNMDTLTIQGLISSDEIRELLELRHDAIYDTSGNFNAKRFIQLETKYEYWEQRIEKILKERHTEDDFIEAGFISVGQGYLNTSIKGVAGFSVNDMTIINPMIFNEIYGESFHHKISQIEAMDLPYYVRQTYKMACIGCRDGLFVCPTVTFENTPTNSRGGIIDIMNGIIQTSATHVRYTHI